MRFNAPAFGAADRRLLPEGRVTGPMPWVIAIMMFLTVLAAAAGLGLGGAAATLETGNRITVQILEADAQRQEAETRSAVQTLKNVPGVASVERLQPEEMRRLLEPWLGAGGLEADIPIPEMIDVQLAAAEPRPLPEMLVRLSRVAPSARIDEHGASLAPLGKLIAALRWLAAGLVLLMSAATAAIVVLAARAALDTHRGTIQIVHLMGATEGQIARLFQRRIALDALFGGMLGLAAALLVLWLVGQRMSALGSELIGSAGVDARDVTILALLPIAGVLLAMAVARWSIMRALRQLS